MNIGEIKKVEVGGIEFFVKYSNRAFAVYMNSLTKEPDSYDAKIQYFYDLSKTGAKAKGLQFNYTFEEFAEIIDPDPNAVISFYNAASSFFGEAGDEKKPKKSSK